MFSNDHALQTFKKPLEEDANGPTKMVTKDDVRLMFSEIPVMVLYSNQLVADLEANVIKAWNDHTKVGTVFLKMVRVGIVGVPFSFLSVSLLSLSVSLAFSPVVVPRSRFASVLTPCGPSMLFIPLVCTCILCSGCAVIGERLTVQRV